MPKETQKETISSLKEKSAFKRRIQIKKGGRSFMSGAQNVNSMNSSINRFDSSFRSTKKRRASPSAQLRTFFPGAIQIHLKNADLRYSKISGFQSQISSPTKKRCLSSFPLSALASKREQIKNIISQNRA